MREKSVTTMALVVLVCRQNVVVAYYPIMTRRCKSTLTKPDGELICPESNRNWCMKEVASLEKDLCGRTQYYGDIYENNICLTRRCADECVEGTKFFMYEGTQYKREVYCCNDQDFCNSAYRHTLVFTWTISIVIISLIFYLVYN
jgi:hypothetical protein